jgi:hypothetical protein
MARFGLHPAKAYARLKGLVGVGLLRTEQPFRGAGVYVATREGLGFAGLEHLKAATVAAGSYAHELAIVDVMIGIELAGDELLVLTEREMRRLGEAYMLRLGTSRSASSRHWPDLALEAPGGKRWAIEVELTRKSRERMDRKLRAYDSSRYEQVVYYVPDQRAASRLRLQGERAYLREGFLSVRVLDDDAKKRASQAKEHAASLAAGERERVQTLEQDARTVPHLQRQLEQHQAAVTRLEEQVATFTAEREAFVRGGPLVRRRMLKQWETEVRSA